MQKRGERIPHNDDRAQQWSSHRVAQRFDAGRTQFERGALPRSQVGWVSRPEFSFRGTRRHPLSTLEEGKIWIRKLLQELFRGKSVHLWWWERTARSELTLFLTAGPENSRWSLSLTESSVRACTMDATIRSAVTRHLVVLLESIPDIPRGET